MTIEMRTRDHATRGEKGPSGIPANVLTLDTPTLLSPWQMKVTLGERGGHGDILCLSKQPEQFFKHFQFVKIQTS